MRLLLAAAYALQPVLSNFAPLTLMPHHTHSAEILMCGRHPQLSSRASQQQAGQAGPAGRRRRRSCLGSDLSETGRKEEGIDNIPLLEKMITLRLMLWKEEGEHKEGGDRGLVP